MVEEISDTSETIDPFWLNNDNQNQEKIIRQQKP
jgi:hypothetical protein